jgi:hypothetical protein
MKFEDNGERIDDLNLILSRVAYAATLFDEDGISLRFMNEKNAPTRLRLDGVKTEQEIMTIVGSAKTQGQIAFQGLTPLGTELRDQVVEPLVISKARNGTFRKPVLVITITDGQPAGEDKDTLKRVLQYVEEEFRRMPQYGQHPCLFQFAQVGNDQKARDFLGTLDANKQFGAIVDCTSSELDRHSTITR